MKIISLFNFLLLISLLAGCASWPAPTRSRQMGADGPSGRCAEWFAAVDTETKQSGVIDAGYARVSRYPYLRINRFLESFQNEVGDRRSFTAWIDQMQALDQEARRIEIANLADTRLAHIHPAVFESERAEAGSPDDDVVAPASYRKAIEREVARCGDILRNFDFRDPHHGDALAQTAAVDADYITLRRVLGIYPFTRLFVSYGVDQWHEQARDSFSSEPPATWQSIRYAPPPGPDPEVAQSVIQAAPRDALGIPSYTAEDQHILFGSFAPVWEIQYKGEYDKIGSPTWSNANRITVDPSRPRTYTLLSFARFAGEVLTQLNYIIWFPSRPKMGMFDLYGGELDGLIYRVTLNVEGVPILYESVHNCGCYYKAFPTEQLQVKQTTPYREPPLVLKAPKIRPSSQRMTVAMESGTHYVRHLYPATRNSDPGALEIRFEDYDALRSLPYSASRRKSMFNTFGLVDGTERLERFILWPTGVLSPGAMRQWGRHAVAFAGKRHFDDPFYMDNMFMRFRP